MGAVLSSSHVSDVTLTSVGGHSCWQELSEQDRTGRNFLAEIFLTGLSEKETKLRQDHQAVEDLHHPLDLLLLPVGERWRFLSQEKPLFFQPSSSFHGRQPGWVGEGKVNFGQVGFNKLWLSLCLRACFCSMTVDSRANASSLLSPICYQD